MRSVPFPVDRGRRASSLRRADAGPGPRRPQPTERRTAGHRRRPRPRRGVDAPSRSPPDTEPCPRASRWRPLDHVRRGRDDVQVHLVKDGVQDPDGWPGPVDGPCPGLRTDQDGLATSRAPRAVARRSMSSAWMDGRNGWPARSRAPSRAVSWNDFSIVCGVERSPIDVGAGGSVYVAISSGSAAKVHAFDPDGNPRPRLAAADPGRPTAARMGPGATAVAASHSRPSGSSRGATRMSSRRSNSRLAGPSSPGGRSTARSGPAGRVGRPAPRPGRCSMSTTASPMSARPAACGATMTAGRSGQAGHTSSMHRHHRTSLRTDGSPIVVAAIEAKDDLVLLRLEERSSPERRSNCPRTSRRGACSGTRPAPALRAQRLQATGRSTSRLLRREDVNRDGTAMGGMGGALVAFDATAPSSMDGRSISPNGRMCWICPMEPDDRVVARGYVCDNESCDGETTRPTKFIFAPDGTLIERARATRARCTSAGR